MNEAADVIGGLTAARMSERLVIQGYDVTVLEAVYHVVEHFSMHTGQIIFATKMLTGEDLGFYRHLSARASTQSRDREGAGRPASHGRGSVETKLPRSAAGTRTPTKKDPNSAYTALT